MMPATMLRIAKRRFSAKKFFIRPWRLLTMAGNIQSCSSRDMLCLISQCRGFAGGDGEPEDRPAILGAQGMVGADHPAAFGQPQTQFEVDFRRAPIADLDSILQRRDFDGGTV